MNRNRIVRFAVDAAETKRILAGLLSALVLLAAGPASAFEATTEADGSTTYFFGTPSLRIESAGALDLSGLRRIETFADGVRANGFFQLAATADAAQALMAPDVVWTGHADGARSLEIAAGSIDLGQADLHGFDLIRIETAGTLAIGGSVQLADGRILSAAGTPGVVQGAVLTIGRGDDPRNPAGSVGSGGTLVILPGADIDLSGLGPDTGRTPLVGPGGTLVILPGADIDLSGSGPDTGRITLVPEPQAWLLLAAGLALMQIFRRRGGAHATGSA